MIVLHQALTHTPRVPLQNPRVLTVAFVFRAGLRTPPPFRCERETAQRMKASMDLFLFVSLSSFYTPLNQIDDRAPRSDTVGAFISNEVIRVQKTPATMDSQDDSQLASVNDRARSTITYALNVGQRLSKRSASPGENVRPISVALSLKSGCASRLPRFA